MTRGRQQWMWFEGEDQIDAHFLARMLSDLRAVRWPVRTAKVSVLTPWIQESTNVPRICPEAVVCNGSFYFGRLTLP
jgi:hypothetical protein